MPRPNPGPRLRPPGKRPAFYIVWTENGRSKEQSTGTADLDEAQAALAAFIAERGRDTTGPRDPARFPIAEALADYGDEHGPETVAPERIAYAIDTLLPFWGASTIGDVDERTCRAFGRWRGRSDGTVRRDLGVMRAAINHAFRHGRLTRPVHVWLPAKPNGRDRWLTRDEAAALLRAARRGRGTRLYLPLFVMLALRTGARKEAILSLRWPQVDLERGRIDLNPLGRRRTSKGRPVIPIPRRLGWFLRQARKRGNDLGFVVNLDGERLGDIKTAFRSAAVRAGLCEPILDGAGGPRLDAKNRPMMRPTISPHTLRHTAGTWMAQAGVPLWDVAGFLGHSHERTAELYSHHSPDHLARARAALD